MRVIAGCYRGRRLRAPAGRETRPILDRVKAALFDWLGAQLAEPGRLPRLDVLDLFSGGGSLGIEALSRGAATCTFVESDRRAVVCLRQNIGLLGLDPVTRVLTHVVESIPIRPMIADGFGLVFLDPPYRLSEDLSPGSVMGRVVARLGTDITGVPGALLVWRHPAACDLPKTLAGTWTSLERRTWGRMAITMFERLGQESP